MAISCKTAQEDLAKLKSDFALFNLELEKFRVTGNQEHAEKLEAIRSSMQVNEIVLHDALSWISQEDAKSIMGSRFVGPGDAGSLFGTEVTFGEVPFSRKELQEAYNNGETLIRRNAVDFNLGWLKPSTLFRKVIEYRQQRGSRKYAEHVKLDLSVVERLLNIVPAIRQVQDEHPHKGWALVGVAGIDSIPEARTVDSLPSLSEMIYDLLVSEDAYDALYKDDFIYSSSKVAKDGDKYLALRLKDQESQIAQHRLDVISKSKPDIDFAPWTYYQRFRETED